MPASLLDRASPRPTAAPSLSRTAANPNPGYEAISRLARLRDILLAAASPARRQPWKVPPLFFFSDRRQGENAASVAPVSGVASAIREELSNLCRSVEVRRVARSLEGLRAAAAVLAPHCSAARDLADLLAAPDDEVVLVLHPEERIGYRLAVRGVVDVGQFHILMAAGIADGLDGNALSVAPLPSRFVAACRNQGPAVPAGIPMTIEARFQLYAPAALLANGALPEGFGGCGHWLWPATPLAAVPRIDGERVVLLGPPAYAASWEVAARFPGLAADVRIIETISAFRVAERLSRFTGKPIPPRSREIKPRELVKAA